MRTDNAGLIHVFPFSCVVLFPPQVEGLVSHTDSAALIYNSASSLLSAGAQVKRVLFSVFLGRGGMVTNARTDIQIQTDAGRHFGGPRVRQPERAGRASRPCTIHLPPAFATPSSLSTFLKHTHTHTGPRQDGFAVGSKRAADEDGVAGEHAAKHARASIVAAGAAHPTAAHITPPITSSPEAVLGLCLCLSVSVSVWLSASAPAPCVYVPASASASASLRFCWWGTLTLNTRTNAHTHSMLEGAGRADQPPAADR